jgi:hypothetical protein
MLKKLILDLLTFGTIGMLLLIALNCSNNNNVVNVVDKDFISGTVTFADSSFGSNSVGYYDVAVFSTWPPTGPPTSNDSLKISKVGGVYKADYKLSSVPNGTTYVVAVGWRRLTGGASPVMGIYGCDTAHVPASTCPLNPTKIQIVYDNGVSGVNFLTWADTTKKIF